jgi:two-component system response regulator
MQKILVIDDSRMIRMRVMDMLPSDNVQIIEARDGQEGLDLIHSERPQLIILDFLLPKKSGWEVYQEIHNSSELNAIPLVLMSGRKEEVTEKISEPFEEFAFVEKPFERDQLVKAIKEAKTKATRKTKTTASAASSREEGEVAALKGQVAQLTEQVQTMQGQIDQLRKQMHQLVNFIKKKIG